jgi:serine/threonine protein kinase
MSERSATGDWRATVADATAELPAVPGYDLVRELGRGGMGVVFQARHQPTGRTVALKLIRNASLATPRELARFRIEAEAAARLDHPNVVRILEVGEHRGGPYIAMEFVAGGTLERFLDGKPQPAAVAARLVHTLANAIQHAHDHNVIHRDLKPANILLESSALVPKVSDFGLAKRLDTDSTALTHDGAVLGTPSYMAPEQAAGKLRDIGPATDVHALGAILYEMLTGRPPFRGDSWNQTIDQVVNAEPTPPARLAAGVPPDLETVCLKCLEKEPAKRYGAARELAEELERYLADRPVAAARPSEYERLVRLAARDGFEVQGVHARGPRGVVYRALYGPLKQPVALKVFPAGTCTSEEWGERVRRGAELSAGLGHPQIVAIQRAGWWDGVPFLAEEFIPHGSLAEQLSSRPQPVVQALRFVEQLTEIIVYAHRQGIVHGNLKPSNVLMAANGIPRIGDFLPPVGLVSPPRPADCTDAASLSYLAPELLSDGESRPHTDIHGLGAILYRLLAGRSAFEAATAAATLERIRTSEPAPLAQYNRDVSPSLDAFCRRCLNRNPWWRYSRTYDVLKRLKYYQEHPEGGDVRER